MSHPPRRASRLLAAALLLLCRPALAVATAAPGPPNVLFIVWDTVRADRMSLYGFRKPTTPFLERWARKARVYQDCVSTASSTVPSHAAMFTGLPPTENGADNSHLTLDGRFQTLAERFREAGYRTYLYSANPHIGSEFNFTQGFAVEEHPWDEKYAAQARRILLDKFDPADRSSELPERLKSGAALRSWDAKATGALARRGLADWLAKGPPGKPWFAFLNYMEAHRPFIPSFAARRAVMSEAQARGSYLVDRSWLSMWSYTFGLGEYSRTELALMAATYDATLVELDGHFRELVTWLETSGELENTIVLLTSDHGEHLGEHHMLDHQYSLYQGLLHVPLVLHHPPRVAAGREKRPVSTLDVYPTLLELAGLPPPPPSDWSASLLAPREGRKRLAEYPSPFAHPIATVREKHPGFDPTPFQRRMRALYDPPYKLIWGSDGRHELYHLANDPAEARELYALRPEVSARLLDGLRAIEKRLSPHGARPQPSEMSEELRERLKSLGYVGN